MYANGSVSHAILYKTGPEVCEPYLTLKSGSKRLLILLKTGKAIRMSGFGGFGHSMYAGSVT
jgi:hypothetical protein